MNSERVTQARQMMGDGEPQNARQLLKDELSENPKNSEAWVLMAQVMENPDQAAFCLKQVIKLDPHNQDASEWLIYIQENNQMPDFSSGDSFLGITSDDGDFIGGAETANAEEIHEGQIKSRIVELFGELVREIQPIDPEDLDIPLEWDWKSDEVGSYIYCSPEVFGILGVRPEEFLGQPYKSFRMAPKSRIAIDYFVKSGLFPFEVPIYFISSGEDLIPMNFSVEVRTEGEKKVGWQGIARVITADDHGTRYRETPTFSTEEISIDEEQIDYLETPDPEKLLPLRTKVAEGEPNQDNQSMSDTADSHLDRLIRETSEKNVCPYMGLPQDPDTRPVFPSKINRCFRINNELRIANDYQSQFCLQVNHRRCKVFRYGLKKPLPKVITNSTISPSRNRNNNLILLVLGFFMLVTLIGLFALIFLTN